MGRAGPAADAALALRAGLGLPVALHGRPAGRACHIIHGNLRKRQFQDTLFVRAEESFRLSFTIKNGR